MIHNNIAVYPVSVFNQESQSFCFIELAGISEKYTFLSQPHRYSFYMLLFVAQGEGSIVVDETRINLDGPKVAIIKPNSVFNFNINRETKGWAICFTEAFFSLRYNDNVLQQFTFIKNVSLPWHGFSQDNCQRWQSIFELIKKEYSGQMTGVDKVQRSYLNILLFDMERWLSPTHKISHLSNKEKKLLEFESLVEATYVQHKTPSFYASQLNITSNYLNKICKSCKGATTGELIRKRVTLEAQRMLYHTTQSVSEIAYALGFDSPSYFVTFIKKNTGSTPEAYRKKGRQA